MIIRGKFMDSDLIRMRIVSIIIIIFFLIYTRLWLGDYFKYHRNPDSYTIYDAYITDITYLGKTDSSIKYSYYFDGIKLENEGSKYWGDKKGKVIKVAVDENGDSLRPDFPLNFNNILIELILFAFAAFEICFNIMWFVKSRQDI